MTIDPNATNEEIWTRFLQAASPWDLNYAEFRFTDPESGDLIAIERVLGPGQPWTTRAGKHWEQVFAAFSRAFRARQGIEQLLIDIDSVHSWCIVEFDDDDDGLCIELSIWPPDVLDMPDHAFDRLVERGPPDALDMPRRFAATLQLVRALQEACDFRKVTITMEGDR